MLAALAGVDRADRPDRHGLDHLQRSPTIWRGSSPRSTTSAAAASAGTSSPPGSPGAGAEFRPRPADRARRALRARARVHGGGHQALGQLGGRRRCSTTARPAATRDPTASAASTTSGKYFKVAGAAEHPALAAGPAGLRAGRLLAPRAGASPRDMPRRSSPRIWRRRRAVDFYADLKRQAVALGRRADQIVILPGLSAVIGSTEAEAQRTGRSSNELSDPRSASTALSNRFGGHDFSHLTLDRRALGRRLSRSERRCRPRRAAPR